MALRVALDGRYIADHFPGIGRYAYALAAALGDRAPAGSSLTLLYNTSRPNRWHDLGALGGHGVRLRRVPAAAIHPVEQVRVPAAVRRLRLDVLHVPHCLGPLWLPCAWVVNVHDVTPRLFPEDVPSRPAALLWDLCVRWAVRRAERIITLSEAARRELIALYGARPERVVAVPAAADLRFAPPNPAAVAAVRARYDLPERFVLYVGTNKPHKNLPRLIEAFAGLAPERAAALVLAGGRDPRFSGEAETTRRLGLERRVLRLGKVPEADLPALYGAATVFAFPSLAEGFGLPALEALACGTPSAVADISSLPEVVGEAALRFDPFDVASIRAALDRLLSDDGLRAELSRRAIDRAARFSWAEAARRTWAVYEAAAVERACLDQECSRQAARGSSPALSPRSPLKRAGELPSQPPVGASHTELGYLSPGGRADAANASLRTSFGPPIASPPLFPQPPSPPGGRAPAANARPASGHPARFRPSNPFPPPIPQPPLPPGGRAVIDDGLDVTTVSRRPAGPSAPASVTQPAAEVRSRRSSAGGGPLRLLEVYKDYWPVRGGIENTVREVAVGLRRCYGVETAVLATSTGRHGWRGMLEGVPVWKVGRLATVARAPLAPGLLWALRRLQPDIAELHFPYPIGELAYLLAGRGRRLVVTYHSDIVRQRGLLVAYRPFLELLLRRADRLIATSPNYAASSPFLSRHLDKTVVIPPGIEPARFRQADPVAVARLRGGAAGPTILFVGVYRYYKGIEDLVKALPRLRAPARLVLVGREIEANVAPLARELGVADRVTFAGEVDDATLVAHYHAADLFCLPARYRSEAFGIVQLEAMAAGLPVVSTELGTGTSYANLDGVTGLVVPPQDPSALAAALDRLLADPALCHRFAAAARARVEAEFTLDRMLERRYTLYQELSHP